MSHSFHKTPKRQVQSSQLMMNLILSGRRARCEVEGCTCMAQEQLEIHHVVPVAVLPIHSTDNLVILCTAHHALIERFYWWERSRLLPSEAREIKEIARKFRARAVRPDDLDRLKARTVELWKLMNRHPKIQEPKWWRQVYHNAKNWASTQSTVRSVDPKDAIIEDPWFRLKEGQKAFALVE